MLWVGHECTGVYVVDVGAKIFEKFNPRDGTVVVGVNDIEYVLHLSTIKNNNACVSINRRRRRRRHAATRIGAHRRASKKTALLTVVRLVSS